MADITETYMQRCIDLALLGEGSVAPNPLVGAILVYNDRIIGEGYHHQYGQAHAEVNCINSVLENDWQFIPAATMYVSLEPCVHFGKTPPCSDLIIEKGIRHVIIGCRDPFEAVNGKGIEKLVNAGVAVVTGVLEQACMALNKRFFTFHTCRRPYIILKWAQTANGKIASSGGERLLISNDFTNRLVHQWRSAEAAILVGTNTALKDDPLLNSRLSAGPSPMRMVLDMSLRLPATLKLFNGLQKTVVFNYVKEQESNKLLYVKLEKNEQIPQQIVNACYKINLQSILVEGGARLLQSFIDNNLWDEVRIITNEKLVVVNGLNAPIFTHLPSNIQKISSDIITFYINKPVNE